MMGELVRYTRRKDVAFIQCKDASDICAVIIAEMMQNFLVRGTYAVQTLPNDDTISLIERLLVTPSQEIVLQLRGKLAALYGRNTEMHAKRLVAELIKRKLSSELDISATIDSYFAKVSDHTKQSIRMLVGG
jgi:hypothetical protein